MSETLNSVNDVRLSREAALLFRRIGGMVAQKTIEMAAEQAFRRNEKLISKELLSECYYNVSTRLIGPQITVNPVPKTPNK